MTKWIDDIFYTQGSGDVQNFKFCNKFIKDFMFPNLQTGLPVV